jgi:hypothetical protein
MNVAASPHAAVRNGRLGAGSIQVGHEHALVVEDHSADGHVQHDVIAATSGLATTRPIGARFCVPAGTLLVEGEIRGARRRLQED